MPRTVNTVFKQDRIELRVSHAQKVIIEKAAQMKGLSLSSYMLNQALQSAKLVLEESEIFKLSSRDRDLFLKSIKKPPAPNKRLKQAMKRGF